MDNIFLALTSNGLLSSCGIKDLNVFYDTIQTNIKTIDQIEYVLLDKIKFNYDTNNINSEDFDNESVILSFGNTGSNEPNNSNGNCFIDTVLLESQKLLFVCGLSSNLPISQLKNGVVHRGKAMTPIVFLYDILEHKSKQIYPLTDNWTNDLIGNITNTSDVAVAFNPNTNKLNYFIKCVRSLSSTFNTTSAYFWVDMDLKYNQSSLTLTDVKILSSNMGNDLDVVYNKPFNTEEKLLITNTANDIIIYSH